MKVSCLKNIETIKIKSKVRVSSTINIQLSNKSDKSIEYRVLCETKYIDFPTNITIPPSEERPLIMNYRPLFVGTKTVELKLYN